MSDAQEDIPETPDLTDYIEGDHILRWLRDKDLPLTRANYKVVAVFGQDEYDWDEEDEAGMPEPLRDYDALAEEMAERETEGQESDEA